MHPLVRTARVTGLLYLGVAISGLLGFLVIRPLLFADGDAAATLANLVQDRSLARAGIVFELLIVLAQVLAAVWFYRLFRPVDAVNAAGIAAFGLVNAVVVLGSAACLATAYTIAVDPVGGDTAASVQLLYLLSGNLWTAGSLFFGLWLIPMGRCVLRSDWMPRALGWILVYGGVGYVISAFVPFIASGGTADVVGGLLVVPATIGEFWMVGYLLVRGVNARALSPADAAQARVAAPV